MSFSPSIRRPSIHAVAITLAVLSIGLLGCPKQDDLPTALELQVPPTPDNFVISNVGTDYTFAWEISDPLQVDRYRVYLVGGGPLGSDEVIIETANTSSTYNVGFSLKDLQFAVTAISPQGVEGQGTVAVAP